MMVSSGLNAMFGNKPRRMSGPPGGAMGMSRYGPIKNLPEHVKRRLYMGLPMGMGMRTSQPELRELEKRNMLPIGGQTAQGLKRLEAHQVQRRLEIARDNDPIFDPSGEPRPGVAENFYAGRPLLEGIGSLLPTPATAVPTSTTPSPAPTFSVDQEGFLADAQKLSTSFGIPIQQAIISLAASRGLDPNQFLNVASVGIGSIAPASTAPPLTGGLVPDKNQILAAITGSGVLPST